VTVSISVSISGDYAIVGAPYDDDNNDTSGSAYIFKRDGTIWSQQAKIIASDGTAWDYFGNSVSISGDYAIVGAFGGDEHDPSGSAYIFKRDGTIWSQQAKITPSDGAPGGWFGYSISISGEYAIVGARGGYCGIYPGSTYIYKRNGTMWSQQAKIAPSDGAAGDLFGISVSISDDYVIAGAIHDGDISDYSGSAYIWRRDETTWSQQAKITPSDGAAYDLFGYPVSISGDYAIVGASGDDERGDYPGSAYILERNGTTWSQQAKINASDGDMFDHFGRTVSISGDYVIAGAYCGDDRGDTAGSAYIFKHNGTTWNEQAKIIASDGAAYDMFGCSVSVSGNYVIVGAQGDDDNGNESGSAYIYDIQTSEPPITGDLNGDGRLTPVDTVTALKMAAGCCEPTTSADVNDDGVVNSLDALIILQAAAGLITL